MLIKVLAPAYYARKDTVTPVKIGIVAMVVNMVLNLLFVLPLMHYWNAGPYGTGAGDVGGGLPERRAAAAACCAAVYTRCMVAGAVIPCAWQRPLPAWPPRCCY